MTTPFERVGMPRAAVGRDVKLADELMRDGDLTGRVRRRLWLDLDEAVV